MRTRKIFPIIFNFFFRLEIKTFEKNILGKCLQIYKALAGTSIARYSLLLTYSCFFICLFFFFNIFLYLFQN